MSRVFSRASLSVRARVSDSSAVADRVLEMREISQPRLSQEVCPPTRKKALASLGADKAAILFAARARVSCGVGG